MAEEGTFKVRNKKINHRISLNSNPHFLMSPWNFTNFEF